MARPRGRNYQKNLLKRQRRATVGTKPPDIGLCFSCHVPMGEHRIPVGDKLICDFCDDIMTKHGYIQLSNYQRLYLDGTLVSARFEIKDVVTGRIDG